MSFGKTTLHRSLSSCSTVVSGDNGICSGFSRSTSCEIASDMFAGPNAESIDPPTAGPWSSSCSFESQSNEIPASSDCACNSSLLDASASYDLQDSESLVAKAFSLNWFARADEDLMDDSLCCQLVESSHRKAEEDAILDSMENQYLWPQLEQGLELELRKASVHALSLCTPSERPLVDLILEEYSYCSSEELKPAIMRAHLESDFTVRFCALTRNRACVNLQELEALCAQEQL